MKKARYHILVFTFLLSGASAFAQNLVPNPSFEEYTECPDWISQIERAVPWNTANQGTPDYQHVCGTPIIGVPENQEGYQWPQEGEAYTGIFAKAGILDEGREYIIAPLDTALTAGAGYFVSFYVSPAEEYCFVRPMGALFTVDTPAYTLWYVLDNYEPQIEAYCGFLVGYPDWIEISGCFIAQGGERYITIGNFRDNSQTQVDQFCPPDFEASYYYVDAITVEERPLSFEEVTLPPVTSCGFYSFDPGNAESYLWDDGTTCSFRYITESGSYSVTLTNSCQFTTVNLDVTIIPDALPVQLPEDVTLCIGETISISLDPYAGDYLWQDGSTASDYLISSGGLYSVILTDACDTTMDEMQVTYLNAPTAFSLGGDTMICDGDAIVFEFDPDLGYFTWQDHTTHTSTYTIQEGGLYALTISNDCGLTSDEFNVGIIYPPDFNIGPPDTILCVGEEILIELDPELGSFEWQDGSYQSSNVVSGAELVIVTVTNACFSESDTMQVNELGPPLFSLGSDLTVCDGTLPVHLDLSEVTNAEQFLWNDGSNQPVYPVYATGVYSVTVANSCFWESDQIQITFEDADPVVTLPPDQLLCPGQSYILDAGGLMGDYHWSTSTGSVSNADTFLVTEAGTYYLIVTNICGSGSDSININYISPLASPDLGSDFSLCPGETGVLYANVDGVTYHWSTSTDTLSTADSLMVTTAGIYFLQISDACSIASDTIVISSNANPPDVDLPEPVDLCSGDSVIVDAGITGVQYQWEGGTTLSSLTIHVPGTYSLTVSNACGSDVDSVIINDAGVAPFVSLGDDFALCPGDTIVVIPEAMGVDLWLWQDGTMEPQYIAALPGIYHVHGSNQCGIASDTIIVTVLPDIPALDLGSDLSICPGETITLSITEPDVEILWNDQSTDDQLFVDEAGVVFATISNACGSSSDTIVVELLPDVPVLDLGEDQSLCPGETITFDPGIPDVDYLWSNGSNAPTFQTTQPGTIILTISNACGSSADTIQITEDTSGPQLDLGPDILACEGETVTLSSGISGVTYTWQDGSNDPEYLVTESGTYILMVSNACGSDSDTVLVDIHGTIPYPVLGPDWTLCDGNTLTLIGGADPGSMILWNGVPGGNEFVVNEPGTYILHVENHCGSGSDTIEVSYESAPLAFDLGEDVVLCPGESIVLNAPSTSDLITWQDASTGSVSTGSTTTVSTSTTILLTISNDCGEVSDEIIVSFDAQEPLVDLGSSQALCPGQSVAFDVVQAFAADYLWSTGSTLPTLQVSQPDLYGVTVSTECYSVSDEVIIEADQECGNELFIPNIFSPNGDNINDQWSVSFSDPSITGIECRIFDRWGDLVYLSDDSPVVWDGVFNGKNLLPGVYAYMIILDERNGGKRILSGDITLVR